MRISSQIYFQRGVDSVLGKQVTLSDQNQHLSSTKRVLTGADDPVAIATIERLKQEVSVGEQYLKNSDAAEATNTVEDAALSQVTNVLQRVRELVVTTGNDIYTEENKEIIASELEGLLEELVGVANTADGNSQYIFSGFQIDTKPFQTNEFGEIDYHGDGGARDYQVGSGVTVQGYDPGSAVFMNISEGNGVFVAQGNGHNTGAGVIAEGSIINEDKARGFVDQDYTVAISQASDLDDAKYSVYGLDDTAVTGNANVTITKVDLNDSSIGSVLPNTTYPDTASEVSVEFVGTSNPDIFEVRVNGVASSTVYDSSNTMAQEISVNGLTLEVDGIPNGADQYSLTKYVEPTIYEDGQSIEFNGIKTEIKGEVEDLDSFTLRQSGEKDIFATIQDTIEALRVPGTDGIAKARHTMSINNALLEVDNAISNISNIHTSVGTRLNTIDSQRETTLDFNLTNQSTLSNLEDLDMAAAISEFQLQTNMLEVSQQTFMQLQGLSLFKMI